MALGHVSSAGVTKPVFSWPMQELSHPNIVQLMGVVSKPPNLAMVTEYLPHSLFHVLHNTNIEVDRKRAISLAKDICGAFIYLHSRSPPVIHRDIKPANFLLDRAWKLKVSVPPSRFSP